MEIESSIYYVPQIKKLKIKDIGVWLNVTLDFAKGMNIITGNAGSGKTTIIESMVGMMSRTVPQNYLMGHKDSKIELELIDKNLISTFNVIDTKKESTLIGSSAGEKAYKMISNALSGIRTGYAILIDNDPIAMLDETDYKKMFKMIQETDGQKIIFIPNIRHKIKNARIFECNYEIEKQYSRIVVKDV